MTEPDNIATIRRMRGEGHKETDIAAALGCSKKYLWDTVRNWNHDNPQNRLPRPKTRPEVPFYVQAANLRKEQGLTSPQIAKVMGRSLTTIHVWLTKAAKEGLIPAWRHSRRDRGGADTWDYYQSRGATPPVGHVRDTLALLSREQIETLLRRLTRDDKTLADLLARMLKDYMDAEERQQG